ncbi:MAG: hypothetical protein GY898_29765 [Proteobacteria bacterium]|nr:hypothetical protein [Pseudomonadota bacterium]
MARHYVTLPVAAVNSFDLPAICFVTGSRERISWRKRVYRWSPPWILLLIVCFPVGVFLSVWLHRQVRVEVPVSDAAWRAWKLADNAGGLSVLATLIGGGIALALADSGATVAAGVVAIGAVLAPFVAFLVARRFKGPSVRRITDDSIEFIIRNTEVADAIRRHFGDLIVEER